MYEISNGKPPLPQETTTNTNSSSDFSYSTKELLDSLPQVWTRGLLYFLIIFASIILPWAILSKVDETGTAFGRLEPKEKTRKLDTPVSATVVSIHVKEGEVVEKGQILVKLESDLLLTELQELENKLEGEENQQTQLELLRNQLTIVQQTQSQQNQAQILEKESQVRQAEQNLVMLKGAYQLQKEERLAQIEQAERALDSSQNAKNIAEINLKGSLEKLDRYQSAYEEGVISLDRFLDQDLLAKENEERLAQAKSDISQAESRLKELRKSYSLTLNQAESDIKQGDLRYQEQQNSYQSLVASGDLLLLRISEELKNLENQITGVKSDIKQTQSQIAGLKLQLNQRVVKAPISGIVFDLPLIASGKVVQPGDLLVEIAPLNSSLKLKAEIATTESGDLSPGLPVKIKFDAYPFQDYGIVEGELINISPTSKVTENETTYDLEIELKQDCLPAGEKCIAFRPGDTATAEVIIRQRRIIDFVLDPFKKLQKEGLKL